MTKEESIKEYYFRINKSINYIKDNLDKELTLDKLASFSNFSKFHFHRIFKSVTAITLNEFIKRARIERALFFLINNSSKSIKEISEDCGFINTSSFARTFKELKKTTATNWQTNFKNSKIGIENSNISMVQPLIENYFASKLNNLNYSNMNDTIYVDFEIANLQEVKVAYVRNLKVHQHDSETFGKMFNKLFKWATPRNLINFPETKAFTVYRSNANLSGMLQADVCITVPDHIEGEGLVGTTKISGGLYAIFHKEAPITECFKTWNFIYEVWFEENGYQPDNRNFFLSHLNDPKMHPEKFHVIDIYIPIKPL